MQRKNEHIRSSIFSAICAGAWVTQWEINVPGLEMLAASCAAAALLNLTQYMILGELFSASCYQVRCVLVCGLSCGRQYAAYLGTPTQNATLFDEHRSGPSYLNFILLA